MKITYVVTTFIVLLQVVWGFNSHTHLIIARIAYDDLLENAPSALDTMNQILDVFKSDYPDKTKYEDNYPFVEGATLADDLRYEGGSWEKYWHYVDKPWLSNGGDISDYPNFVFRDDNLTLIVPELVMWLSKSSGYQDTYTYQTMNKYYSEEDAESLALRFLIHFVGDYHQPLHCMDRVNDDYPKGDSGGNDFTLPYHYNTDNLHALWDNVIYKYHNSIHRPFDDDGWEALGEVTAGLVSTYDLSKSSIEDLVYSDWGYESYEMGVENAYVDVVIDESVPQSYIDKNQPMLDSRVTLAGLRLSKLLQTIYGSKEEFLQ